MLLPRLSITLPAAFQAAGFSFLSTFKFSKKQSGQASLELLIVWPIIVVSIFTFVQALFIWWAQQTLTMANQYAVRAGSLNHGRNSAMVNTLVSGMAALKPQLDTDNKILAAAESIAEQRLHFAQFGRLKILSPTAEDFRQFAAWRWDEDKQTDVLEISVDHYHARAAENTARQWHKARILVIETYWCLPLDIPVAAELLAATQRLVSGSGAANYCASRGVLYDRPLWGLSNTAQHAMLSGYRN
ncbi:pilus assembly protein [Idiomarina sp. HP20-50]|uniref:pilus assembly protein n=1 Tax=Idiomarina sp. HP20-50 TaxID=3070813 RepID=UPI00294B0499|nr:pilus assembly protein [Idiomarina sp. HP20-50]MDV6316836.1 pilus assembly protein [Idiomarina sp. HP20-50]